MFSGFSIMHFYMEYGSRTRILKRSNFKNRGVYKVCIRREVDTGLESYLKIYKFPKIRQKFTNYSEIYDNSSAILKFMKNSQKSITNLWKILKNQWKIHRQLLIHKFEVFVFKNWRGHTGHMYNDLNGVVVFKNSF
jgi:hypothetical protein